MKVSRQPPATIWSLVLRFMALLAVCCALVVLLPAVLFGAGVEQALYMTAGQIGHMVINYPIWAWLLFVGLLLTAVRLWGVIGVAFMLWPISKIVYRLDVMIIGSAGADTADLIFALGYFYRLAILAVMLLPFIVVPGILWRRRRLHLSTTQAIFSFRLRRPGSPNQPLQATAAAPSS